MSSIREVARVAGVSTATVSRALSQPASVSKASLERVHAAIAKVNYQPNMMARNFRAMRTYSVVVLVPNIANLFFSTVISGIGDAAQQAGYSILLGDTRDSLEREKDYINLVQTRQADGVLQLRPYAKGVSLEVNSKVPMVNACGCENTPYPTVRIDNVGAAEAMMEHLMSLGHRRIGLIAGKADNPHTIDRLAGYIKALQAAAIGFDGNLVFNGDFTLSSGITAANYFASMPNRPTAVLSMNDEMAIGALKGFKNHGLNIPHDMSITGFDNLEVTQYTDPALTTVGQPAKQLGHIAFGALLNVMEGRPLEDEDIVLPFELILRSSTAPLRNIED